MTTVCRSIYFNFVIFGRRMRFSYYVSTVVNLLSVRQWIIYEQEMTNDLLAYQNIWVWPSLNILRTSYNKKYFFPLFSKYKLICIMYLVFKIHNGRVA